MDHPADSGGVLAGQEGAVRQVPCLPPLPLLHGARLPCAQNCLTVGNGHTFICPHGWLTLFVPVPEPELMLCLWLCAGLLGAGGHPYAGLGGHRLQKPRHALVDHPPADRQASVRFSVAYAAQLHLPFVSQL